MAQRWERLQAAIEAREESDAALANRAVAPGRAPAAAGDAGTRYEALVGDVSSNTPERVASEDWLDLWETRHATLWQTMLWDDATPNPGAVADAAQGAVLADALIDCARRPTCRWSWDYRDPLGNVGLWPTLARSAGEAHALRVLDAQGRAALLPAAVDLLAVARDLLTHPFPQAGCDLAYFALEVVRWTLSTPNLDPQAVQRVVEALDQLPELGLRRVESQRLFDGARYASSVGILHPADPDHAADLRELHGRALEPLETTLERLWSAGDTSQRVLLERANEPLADVFASGLARADAVRGEYGDPLVSPDLHGVRQAGDLSASVRALKLLARVRLAELEGRPRPTSVGAIDPRWIEQDPYTHQPLRVVVRGREISAYSVGADGVDDGGADTSESDDVCWTLR